MTRFSGETKTQVLAEIKEVGSIKAVALYIAYKTMLNCNIHNIVYLNLMYIV